MSEVPLRSLPLAILLLGIAVALAPSAGALAAEPSDLESNLTISVGGVEKTLTLGEAMAALNIPSVSLALIDQDQLAFARAYGEDATPETLYQAASLSKFVAAVGAMRLVDQERLDLDEDVNARLTSWRVPTNGFDQGHPVTLRGLLSMTAGIGVPGFLGYEVGAPLPNLTQILYGTPPANSPPITVIAEPGSAYAYSGGSYEIAEALVEDATKAPFPDLMDALVLKPAGMSRSTFAQPLPPESRLFLRPETVREMLTPQNGGPYGLGATIGDADGALVLTKRGQNVGYQAYQILLPAEGRGMVVMTDSDNGSILAEALIRRAAALYGWPALGALAD